LIVHADMDRVLGCVERGERPKLAQYLARLIDRLAGGGAEVAANSAITPHFCIRELKKISALPLVNIIEVVGNEIRSRGYPSRSARGSFEPQHRVRNVCGFKFRDLLLR
jgi:aspartate racemase